MNDVQLYTCGWDSKVKLNNVVNSLSNKSESEDSSVQMDVNGESNSEISSKKVKCNGNDVTIETNVDKVKLETT